MEAVFNKLTLEALSKAGWRENEEREADMESLREQIIAEGFPLFDSVLLFMKKFGGLKIPFKVKGFDEVLTRYIEISFDKGTYMESYERIQILYEPRIGGKRLCVIGAAHNNYLVLMMDEHGCVYAGYDEFFCKYGDSGEEAINKIVNEIRGEIIP